MCPVCGFVTQTFLSVPVLDKAYKGVLFKWLICTFFDIYILGNVNLRTSIFEFTFILL